MTEYVVVDLSKIADMALLLISLRNRDTLSAFLDLLPENAKLSKRHFQDLVEQGENISKSLRINNTVQNYIDELIDVLKEEGKWE